MKDIVNEMDLENYRDESIETLAEYISDYLKTNNSIRDMKIGFEINEDAMEIIANTPFSREGRPAKEVADELVNDVFRYSMNVKHPRFFSFVSSAVSPYGLAGAILTDIYNPHGGGWIEAPQACLIEEKLIRWMGGLAGYPDDTCGGLFVSGGSMANMSLLAAARDKVLGPMEYGIGVAYISDQTHSSVAKGLRIIGFRNDQIEVIPSDERFRMRTDFLEERILKDREEGKKPFAVIGSLGTTNTGAIDPLSEIGDICEKYGLWFHVDGAFGASVLLSENHRYLADGIEKSDSFSWDTHKWALQPYSSSSMIVKDKKDLLRTYSEHPVYLKDVISAEHNDPWDLGPEMSRPHRAIKFWFTVQAMGTDKLGEVIDQTFENADIFVKEIEERDGWSIISEPSCGTLTFRFEPEGYSEEELNALNAKISHEINNSGYACIVTTKVKKKTVLRACLINYNTSEEDIRYTMYYLDEIAKTLI